MNNQGYIKIWRGILEKDAYKVKFSPGAAWIDLLLMTEYKDGRMVVHRGIKVELKRGQAYAIGEELAKRWCWKNKYKVLRQFEEWAKEGQISRPTSKIPIVQITNYDQYQFNEEDAIQNFTKVQFKMQFKKSAAEPIITDISSTQESENAIQNAIQNSSKVQHYTNKDNILTSSISAPARTYEEELFKALAADTDWLDTMAMNYCSTFAETREGQLQSLYDLIKQLRERFFLDGKQHRTVSELKQHIRMSIQGQIRINNQQTEESDDRRRNKEAARERRGATNNERSRNHSSSSKRSSAKPSTTFSATL